LLIDLEEAALWYYLKNPALAERLINETQRLLRLIAKQPTQFPVRFKDVHRAKLSGFPHSIYFIITSDSVLILALIHGARDVHPLLMGRAASSDDR
jgi:plasmid stabilization system protein ParE